MKVSPISKYFWLLNLIDSRGKISLETIDKEWHKCPLNEMQEKMHKSALYRHIRAIDALFGVQIQSRRGVFYIVNRDDIDQDRLTPWLVNSLRIESALRDNKQLHSRIVFESIPRGYDHLLTAIHAMSDEVTLNITYESYYEPHISHLEIEPYCVKAFKQRWYVLGHVLHNACPDDPMRTFALDRVTALVPTDRHWHLPDDFSAEEYFSPFYGIVNDMLDGQEWVKVRVSAKQTHFLRTLPIHKSQREVETHEDYSIFEYHVVPTIDFEMELRMHGHELEVLEPEWVRDDFAWDSSLNAAQYKNRRKVKG